jgi:hypothetical protein
MSAIVCENAYIADSLRSPVVRSLSVIEEAHAHRILSNEGISIIDSEDDMVTSIRLPTQKMCKY